MMNAPLADLRRKPRPEPVPPGANRFMADIDAAFVEQIFDLPQRKRIPDIHHHGLALAYRRYSKQYVLTEDGAREARRGMWHGTFAEPWAWRKAQ